MPNREVFNCRLISGECKNDIDAYFNILKKLLVTCIGRWIIHDDRMCMRWLISCNVQHELSEDYRLSDINRYKISSVMNYDFKGPDKCYASITNDDVCLATWYYSRIYSISSVYMGININVSIDNGSNTSVIISSNGDRYLDVVFYRTQEQKSILLGTYDSITKRMWCTDNCDPQRLQKLLGRIYTPQCNMSTLSYVVNHLVS